MAEKLESLNEIKAATAEVKAESPAVTNRAVLMPRVREKTLLPAYGLNPAKATSPSMTSPLISTLPARF